MFESWKSTNCKDLRKKVESFLFLEGHDKLQNTYTEVREKKRKTKGRRQIDERVAFVLKLQITRMYNCKIIHGFWLWLLYVKCRAKIVYKSINKSIML